MNRIRIDRRRFARDLDFLGLARRSSEPVVILTIGACSALFSISGLILHRGIRGPDFICNDNDQYDRKIKACNIRRLFLRIFNGSLTG
jgi:hypothetical protein